MNNASLIVIGAGPKAMAIAAKNHVLASLGAAVPHVHILERRKVGAHWTGDSGFTNGVLRLSTAPEKDVGFPYQSTCWAGEETNRLVDAHMLQFSWQSFLVATGAFSDWIDRGRPAPEHRKWAEYLQWVAGGATERVTLHWGEAHALALEDDRWRVTYRGHDGQELRVLGDGLVLTGPGVPNALAEIPRNERVLTVEAFWRDHARFRTLGPTRVAIVGSGESAAAVAMELAASGRSEMRVDIVSPVGMTFSRGESYRENRVYSDPDAGRWQDLSERERRGFIHRTDRGVFSLAAQRALDQATNLEVRSGRLTGVHVAGDRVELDLTHPGRRETYACDYVVLATGSDHLGIVRRMADDRTLAEILGRAGLPELTDRAVEPRIGEALELRGLLPKLHLPMLSGVAQGPGFANLSCLGRLSDGLLEAYVPAERRAAVPGATRRAAQKEPRRWMPPEAALPPAQRPAHAPLPPELG